MKTLASLLLTLPLLTACVEEENYYGYQQPNVHYHPSYHRHHHRHEDARVYYHQPSEPSYPSEVRPSNVHGHDEAAMGGYPQNPQVPEFPQNPGNVHGHG